MLGKSVPQMVGIGRIIKGGGRMDVTFDKKHAIKLGVSGEIGPHPLYPLGQVFGWLSGQSCVMVTSTLHTPLLQLYTQPPINFQLRQ